MLRTPERSNTSASTGVTVRCSVEVVLTATGIDVLDRFGHALTDPIRTRVLLALRGGAYPTELGEELGVSRTNSSDHLARLRGCGSVVAVPEGERQRYELADGALRRALDDWLQAVLAVEADACQQAPTLGCC